MTHTSSAVIDAHAVASVSTELHAIPMVDEAAIFTVRRKDTFPRGSRDDGERRGFALLRLIAESARKSASATSCCRRTPAQRAQR
jgi:hypothetical protein